jgi:2-polyprenyl-6-methoxyphenol hydroxylase-like FAD-dependent oxidoreductase
MSGDSSVRPPHGGVVRYGPELRVLIVGAGVAGLTLAGLLEQRGFAPVVVEKEREPSPGELGYVIRLWPAGSRVLKGLGLYPAFREAGLECTQHKVATARGDVLHSCALAGITNRYGPLVNISRPGLVAVLRQAMAEERIRYGVTVRDIAETPDGVVALFTDGKSATFDLVVGCDGAHSGMRHLLFDDVVVTDPGITGWGFCLPVAFDAPPQVIEYWGAGKFFGIYPARDRICAFAGVWPRALLLDPIASPLERLKAHFHDFGGLVPWVLANLDRSQAVCHDDYIAVHTGEWFRGRVVLMGDAAHATPPTGGMGASLAMESAAVLADELCRTDSACITLALQQYVARRRARVDRVQARSQLLLKMIFTPNRIVARLRDGAMQIAVDEQLLDFMETVLLERI